MSIRVLIADDQALLRRGFRLIINSDPGMTVVGEASDGEEAIVQAKRLNPDVVLMDVRMPGTDGIQATRRITSSPDLNTRILILTTFDLDEYVYSALRSGASGFILKDTTPEDLLHAVRVVASGDALLAPAITRRLIAEFAKHRDPHAQAIREDLGILTDREIEVLHQVARGRSNAEIARALYIRPGTAKTHVSRLLSKLDARDRAQLVVIAYETGVVIPDAQVDTSQTR